MVQKDIIIERLKKEGWKRKFTACEPRLSEAVKIYKDAGFEVHLEPLRGGDDKKDILSSEMSTRNNCTGCFIGCENSYRIIFTRPSRNRPAQDDLF